MGREKFHVAALQTEIELEQAVTEQYSTNERDCLDHFLRSQKFGNYPE